MAEPEELPKKKFRVERKRLGRIVKIINEKHFGFIDAEDFRDDVMFLCEHWEPDGSEQHRWPQEGVWVEYDLDDDYWEKEKRLRATAIRPTKRPTGRKLSGRDATFQIITHHPNAKRKKPGWRR